MITVVKEFEFEAAHQLEDYDGDCSNIHGHSYKLSVGIKGYVNPQNGFVMDFKDLKSIVKKSIVDWFDHAFLAKGNEKILPLIDGNKVLILGFKPTAENIVQHIAWKLYKEDGLNVDFVKLYETDTSYAEVKLEDLLKNNGPDYGKAIENEGFDLNETLSVSEIFGPTIQGEGMSAGKKALFIRLYGCDYGCVWCDSRFAWDGTEDPKEMTVKEILDMMELLSSKSNCKFITFTGGNPCIHQSGMDILVKMLKDKGYTLAIETQASISPSWINSIDEITLSPKPPSGNKQTSMEEISNMFGSINDNKRVSFKIVIFNDNDYKYFKKVYGRYKSCEWYVQPGNEQSEGGFDIKIALDKYKWLCEKILSDNEVTNVRPLPQLHTLLWGNQREV